MAIDRLFYQFPLGNVTFSVGGRIGQEDMLAIWPSVYPSDTVLDVLTLGGAPAAYNKNLGLGAGVWWLKNGFAISANDVAANGDVSQKVAGGIATSGSGGTSTVQLGYSQDNWGLAAIFSSIQNGNDLIVHGTNFSLNSFSNPGTTNAWGLSGFWQPAQAGWIPSISAGWGFNRTNSSGDVDETGLVATSQSWSVGLQWQDGFAKGNGLGMGVGQPTLATALYGGGTLGLPQFYGQVSRHLQLHLSRFRMALLKGNWCAITYRGMETFPIVVVFYPYPKIVQQLLWITDQTIKDLKFIF